MTLPNLFTDNPLSKSNVPEEPLRVQLPARGQAMPDGHSRSVARILVSGAGHFAILFTAIIAYGLIGVDKVFVQVRLFPLETGGVFLLAICIAFRPYVRRAAYSTLLIAVAHGAAFVAAVGAMQNGPTHGLALNIIQAELFLLVAMEMGFHFLVLAEMDGRYQASNGASNFRNLLIYVFVTAILILIIANSIFPIAGLWVILTLATLVGAIEATERFKDPFKAVLFHLGQFFFYPNQGEMAPGLIASPAGNCYIRTGLVAIPMAVMWSMAGASIESRNYLSFVGWLLLPPFFFLTAATLVIGVVAPATTPTQRARLWEQIVTRSRNSDNEIERNSIYFGQVAADMSPILVDRSLLYQHCHFLGSSGSGKTSQGLCPLIEQIISFDDSTVVIIDLKGDSHEMLAAAHTATKRLKTKNGGEMPIRVFSLENGTMTHAFNPFLTQGWIKQSIHEKTDIICAATGLSYGFDYGRAFFTAMNSKVITATNLENPDAMSFRQMHLEMVKLLESDSLASVPEIKKAGAHAFEVISRLAAYESLNVTPSSPHDDAVIENQIDLAKCYEQPQVLYFKLPSLTASIGAPSVARLIMYYLLLAGKSVDRKVKVHVVMDEFQRMAIDSLDHMFQMARSLDVGLIIANQSLNDLRVTNPKVFNAVVTNCAIRQWFSVSGQEDIATVEKLMGTREKIVVTASGGHHGTSYSYHTEDVPRASVTDLLQVSEDPRLSILQIAGSGRGYARYGGVPFVCCTDFHITPKEYDRRKRLLWPSKLPGMIEAKEIHSAPPSSNTNSNQKKRPKPKSNRDEDSDPSAWNSDLFE